MSFDITAALADLKEQLPDDVVVTDPDVTIAYSRDMAMLAPSEQPAARRPQPGPLEQRAGDRPGTGEDRDVHAVAHVNPPTIDPPSHGCAALPIRWWVFAPSGDRR